MTMAMVLASVALGALKELTICYGGSCSRCGAKKPFAEVAQALTCTTPSDECEVRMVGCLGPCPNNGVAVQALGLPGRGKWVIQPKFTEENAALNAVDAAAEVLSTDFGLDVEAPRAALISKLLGDDAAERGNNLGAISAYGEAVDSELARSLVEQARQAAALDDSPVELPRFGLTAGLTYEREYARLRPGRVRWLFEALIGRCQARLAEGGRDNAVAALADATDASALCKLAGEGWYRMRDAAKASGDDATAAVAVAELKRLGYSLEEGQEGLQAAGAKPAMKLDYWGRPMA